MRKTPPSELASGIVVFSIILLTFCGIIYLSTNHTEYGACGVGRTLVIESTNMSNISELEVQNMLNDYLSSSELDIPDYPGEESVTIDPVWFSLDQSELCINYSMSGYTSRSISIEGLWFTIKHGPSTESEKQNNDIMEHFEDALTQQLLDWAKANTAAQHVDDR